MSRLPDLSKLSLFGANSETLLGKRGRDAEVVVNGEIVMPDALFKQLQWFLGHVPHSPTTNWRLIIPNEVAVNTERFVLNLKADKIRDHLVKLQSMETRLLVQFVKLVVDTFRDALYTEQAMIRVINHGIPQEIAPKTNPDVMLSIAQVAADAYFQSVSESGSDSDRIAKTREAVLGYKPDNETDRGRYERIQEIRVDFHCNSTPFNEITVTKPRGLFTPQFNDLNPLNGDFTTEYDRGSFVTSCEVSTSGLSKPMPEMQTGGETVETFPFYNFTDNSLNQLAESAHATYVLAQRWEQRRMASDALYARIASDALRARMEARMEARMDAPLPQLTNEDWILISKQCLISAQAAWGTSEGTRMQQTAESCLRLTDKTMTRHTMRIGKTFNWCVTVTLQHKQKWDTHTDQSVFVTHDYLTSTGSVDWKQALYFYEKPHTHNNSTQLINHSDFMTSSRNYVKFEVSYHATRTFAGTQAFYDAAAALLLLNVEYTYNNENSIVMTRIGLGFLGEFAGTDFDHCVSVRIKKDNSLYLDTLFYAFDQSQRARCNIYMSGDTSNTKKGSGAVILKLLTDIGSSLQFSSIALQDEATFVQLDTMPYFDTAAGGEMFITSYLRAVRGYGFYESFGFFSTIHDDIDQQMEEQQLIVNFHHELFTKKIGELKLMLAEELEPHSFPELHSLKMLDQPSKEELESILKEFIKSRFGDKRYNGLSMRDILKKFNDTLEPHRPKEGEVTFDENDREEEQIAKFTTKWKEKYFKSNGGDTPEDFSEQFSLVCVFVREVGGLTRKWDRVSGKGPYASIKRTLASAFVTSKKLLASGQHLRISPPIAEGGPPKVVKEKVQYQFKVGTITKDDKKMDWWQLL